MNEIPLDGGGSTYEVSDSNLGIKAIRRDKTPADIDTLASARRLAGLERVGTG